MQLNQSLRVQPKDVIAFTGGGGKTTALFRLADEIAASGQRVVTTTTTRLAIAQVQRRAVPRPCDMRIHPISSRGFASAAAARNPVLIVGEDVEEEKVGGVPPAFIDQLAALDFVDVILYEADGARHAAL